MLWVIAELAVVDIVEHWAPVGWAMGVVAGFVKWLLPVMLVAVIELISREIVVC